MEQLMDEVRKVRGLNRNLRLQYQDRDFGDALVNLTSTAVLEDLATLKVIPITDDFSQGLKLTINAKFMGITTVPLQPRLVASLDKHHNKMIEIFRSKRGAVKEKTWNKLKVVDQVVQRDEAETELERCTMAVFVIREEEDPLQPPHDIEIVIE
ncbi:hypothetical protein L3Q82_025668, partial [Scortum barcoo]